MSVSKKVRLLAAVLASVGFSLAHADDGESKRSDVLRILKTNAPELVTQNEEMVPDWQLQRAATMPIVQVERVKSERAEMGVEVIEAITFWDDDNRYDLILDEDGAIVLDLKTQSVSDSFTFTVGPVPTIKNPKKVFIATLGVMASRNGNSGTFDMEVEDLTSTTVMDAFEWSDAATVFIDSGTVVALFYANGELVETLHFSPLFQETVEGKQLSQDGSSLLEDPRYQLKLKKVCDIVYDKCVNEEDVSACGHWLDHCQQAP